MNQWIPNSRKKIDDVSCYVANNGEHITSYTLVILIHKEENKKLFKEHDLRRWKSCESPSVHAFKIRNNSDKTMSVEEISTGGIVCKYLTQSNLEDV